MVLGFAASGWLVWRRHFSLATFLVLGLLAPLATGTVMSGTRYAMGLFPIYLALAAWTARRRGGILRNVVLPLIFVR